MPIVLDLPDVDATVRLGHTLGAPLGPGCVVALVGDLGAGKTHLARAIAEGLGLRDGRMVTSPTFVLLQEYPGRVPIYHFDTYRLPSPEAFADLGAAEFLEGDGVCLVEWADRVPAYLPDDVLCIRLEVAGETARRATLDATGPRHEAVVMALASGAT